MEKIKVGDKVMVKKWEDVQDHLGIPYAAWREHQDRTYTVSGGTRDWNMVCFCEDDGLYIWPAESLVQLIDSKRIVILQDGTTTRAIEYKGRRRVKEAMAKLHPDDEYRWETGRDLALNRLIYGTDYHPQEVAFQEEEKPLYNGKVVCVDHNGLNQDAYTIGRIYQFRDGSVINDRGVEVPFYEWNKVRSFDEWARFSTSKWIEIVED